VAVISQRNWHQKKTIRQEVKMMVLDGNTTQAITGGTGGESGARKKQVIIPTLRDRTRVYLHDTLRQQSGEQQYKGRKGRRRRGKEIREKRSKRAWSPEETLRKERRKKDTRSKKKAHTVGSQKGRTCLEYRRVNGADRARK